MFVLILFRLRFSLEYFYTSLPCYLFDRFNNKLGLFFRNRIVTQLLNRKFSNLHPCGEKFICFSI